MKMNKQTKAMVDAVNAICKEQHIKDVHHPLFANMCWLLSQAGCYHGFNFFTVDGRLSGGENDQFDHLQIYIR